MHQPWMWIAMDRPVMMMARLSLLHWKSPSAQPAAQPGESLGSTGLSGSSASAPRTLLGAEAPPGLLAIEDIKPDEYYQASDQIRGALQDLPEQIQQNEESQLASWVHTTENYPDNLWMDCEYARKACDRTGARINFVIRSLSSDLTILMPSLGTRLRSTTCCPTLMTAS